MDRIVRRPQMREELARILRFHEGKSPKEAGRPRRRRIPKRLRLPERRSIRSGKAERLGHRDPFQKFQTGPWQATISRRCFRTFMSSTEIGISGTTALSSRGLPPFSPGGKRKGKAESGHRDRSGERAQREGKSVAQLRNAFAGRLPKGPSPDEAGGEVRQAHRLLRGYSRRFCGMEAEERGQGEAIARNLFEMADLKVPVLLHPDRGRRQRRSPGSGRGQ